MKIGDRLVPRRDLVTGEVYGNIRILKPMYDLLKKLNCVEVTYVGGLYFYIKQGSLYAYSKEMFMQKED